MNDDPAAVRADDAALDALPGAELGRSAGVIRLLAAWRRDVHAEPVGVLVDTDTALSLIRAARKPRTETEETTR